MQDIPNATLLFKSGASAKVTQERLGYSSLAFNVNAMVTVALILLLQGLPFYILLESRIFSLVRWKERR
jgi:hypothetical protein